MKRVFKIIAGVLLAIYLILVVCLTTCLLTFNDYKISVIGDKSLLIVNDNTLNPDYKKGDLLVITKNDNKDIKVNDKIFFYNHYQSEVVVNISTVDNVQKITDTETTFTVNKEYDISSEYVIGKTSTTKVYSGLGEFLKILESKWGFLCLIILPITILFIFEIYAIIMEIKNSPVEEKNAEDNLENKKKEENLSSEENKEEIIKVEKETNKEENVNDIIDDKKEEIIKENKEEEVEELI